MNPLLSLSGKFFKNYNKKQGCEYDAGIVDNSQNRRGEIVAVHVRSQDLGTDERSDQRPLWSGKVTFHKIVPDIFPKQVDTKRTPPNGDDIRYHKRGKQHACHVNREVSLNINRQPMHAESVKA